MSKKVRNILVICLVVVGIAAISVGAVFLMKPSDKEVFTDALKRNLSSIKELGSSDETTVLDNLMGIADLKQDVKLKFTTDTKISTGELSSSINGELYADLVNKLMHGNLTMSSGEIGSFSIDAALKDSKIYHKIKDVYSKFYYSELTGINTESDSGLDLSGIDFSLIVDYLEESILEHIDDDNLTKEDKTLTFDDAEFETIKYTVTFTEKDVLEIAKSLIDKIKGNEELYSSILSAIEVIENALTSNTVTGSFDFDFDTSAIDEAIKEADDEKTLVSYSTYLDGDTIISNDLVIVIDSGDTAGNLRISISSYENKDGFDSFEAYVSMMGIKLANIKLNGVSDTKSNISISIISIIDMNGTVELTDTGFDLSLKIESDTTAFGETAEKQELGTLNISCKEITKYEEYDLTLSVQFNSDENEITIESNNKFTVVDEIPEIDLSDSADISEMTEEEKAVYDSIFGMLSSSIESEDLLS